MEFRWRRRVLKEEKAPFKRGCMGVRKIRLLILLTSWSWSRSLKERKRRIAGVLPHTLTTYTFLWPDARFHLGDEMTKDREEIVNRHIYRRVPPRIWAPTIWGGGGGDELKNMGKYGDRAKKGRKSLIGRDLFSDEWKKERGAKHSSSIFLVVLLSRLIATLMKKEPVSSSFKCIHLTSPLFFLFIL